MKATATFGLMLGLVLAITASGQARGGQRGRGGQPQPPPAETIAPNIPGVVSAGTKVEPIKDGFMGTEGPIGMPDGSLIFTETNANRITKIDANGNTSVFLENTNGSNGLAWDSRGRLISVQTVPGNTKIGVIYPANAVSTLADNFEGKPLGPAETILSSARAAACTSRIPGPNAPPRGSAAPAPANTSPPGGRLLHRTRRKKR